MQTFLPFEQFDKSAACLDRQRLGKQRVEVLQLLRALKGETKGWANHPAARMWRGYEAALIVYGLCICGEWMRRGYKDTCADKLVEEGAEFLRAAGPLPLPPWLGDEAFHRSHRSNLLRKDSAHYSVYFTDVSDDLPYVWPQESVHDAA
jgi:hypothetical protein